MTEEKKEYIRENGFIVISLTYLFELMEKISIFYFIRWIGKRIGDNADDFLRNGIFSEIWVLGNLVFAIIAQNVVKKYRRKVVKYCIYVICNRTYLGNVCISDKCAVFYQT